MWQVSSLPNCAEAASCSGADSHPRILSRRVVANAFKTTSPGSMAMVVIHFLEIVGIDHLAGQGLARSLCW